MGELQVANFDLRLTLESGQCFRYREEHDTYVLLTSGKKITVVQEETVLRFTGADEQSIAALFQLTPDYASQLRRLEEDAVLVPLLQRYRGLHIMRQDLHETIIGFLCSSQSNIPKIKMNMHLLSTLCGVEVDGHHHLPAPGCMLDHGMVLSAKTGYRAKFIVATNKLLTKEFLDAVVHAEYADAHALLCTLPGIGPKIADCICLFALGHGEAFPVDVHVMRAMKELFPRSRLSNERRVKMFAQKRWGRDAGLAQQFIFQYARDNLVMRKVAA